MLIRSRPLRLVGALLAATTFVDAVWWASADDDAGRVRLGIAGLLAVVVVWASGARSGPRAGVRATAGLALGALGWVAAASAPLWGVLVPMLFGGDSFSVMAVSVEDSPSVWFGTLGPAALLLLAAVVAQRTRARRASRSPDPRLLLVALPFALLAVTALADGAQVQALIAVASAAWVVVMLRRRDPGAAVPAVGSVAGPPGAPA